MNKNILIIDDSESIRELVGASLEEADFSVHKAINGQDGLDQLLGKDIHLIITDLNMPVMDGLTFVKELRGNTLYSDIPIVMITTEGAKSEVVEALKMGVNNYIVKPFDKDTLLGKVKATIEG